MPEYRLQELIELAIHRTRADQSKEAPDTEITNSNVYITNNYNDAYEPTASVRDIAPPAEMNFARNGQTIRKDIIKLALLVEQKMSEFEQKNPDGFTTNAASATEGLKERFEELQLRLKGDTSIVKVQDAYLMMLIQLILSVNLSEVFGG